MTLSDSATARLWQASNHRHLSEDPMSPLYPERDSLAATELTAGTQPPRLNPKAHHFTRRPP